MKQIPDNVKLVIKSIGPLVVVLFLSLIVGNFGISKVRSLRSQISQAQNNNNILTQKVDLLRNVSGSLSGSPDIATIAVPDSNPSLVVISQLKLIAGENSVVVSNIKTGAETKDKSGLSSVAISFDAEGPREQIIAFLNTLSGSAPIIKVDKLKLTENSGITKAGTTVDAFWADLPKTLPALDNPIADLTSDEKSTLAKITQLNLPIFNQVNAATESAKSNPFGP